MPADACACLILLSTPQCAQDTRTTRPQDPGSVRKAFEAAIPMKRYGTNGEVAKLVTFLASDGSSNCTGGIFSVDGGGFAAS